MEWRPGIGGLPVIEGCAAVFECSPEAVHDGGDHVILVGEVQALDEHPDQRPLLGYLRGRYVEFG